MSNHLMRVQELLKLDEKFKNIRAKIRLRDREINELNHLSVKATKFQTEITHQQNRIDADKSTIGNKNKYRKTPLLVPGVGHFSTANFTNWKNTCDQKQNIF